MKNLKVLQVCAVDFTVKNILLPWINKCEQEGAKVEIVCSDGPDVTELREKGYRIRTIEIVRHIAPLKHLFAILNLWRYMKNEKFDVVHVHTPIASVLGRIAARLAGVPLIIYTAHGFYFHDNMVPWKRNLVITLEKLMGQWCTDVVVTVSLEDYQAAVEENIISASNLYHVNNGISLSRFDTANAMGDKCKIRQELGIALDAQVIGFVGRIVREKGVLDLLEAFKVVAAKQPATVLLIVGDNRAKDRDAKIQEDIDVWLMNNRSLREQVIFAGHRTDVEKVLNCMDVFTLPSYREGLPLSILEAMAMCKPVVATDIRGCREEVLDGETGFLVPVGCPGELGRALNVILGDDEKRKKMGEKARKRIEEEFNDKKTLPQMWEILLRHLR